VTSGCRLRERHAPLAKGDVLSACGRIVGERSIGGAALVEADTLGDEELKRDALDALSRRREWPDGMRRYIASLYELDVDTWQRVTDFIERAATIGVKHAGGADSPRSLA
jgi:hypothetical protein